MALLGLITDEGIAKAIEAENNSGFRVFPQSFGVSEIAGDFNTLRNVGDTNPEWFTGPISAVQQIDENTLQFICNIPANATTEPKFTNEIYLYGKSGIDQLGPNYLIAIAQPTSELTYDPDGELRLRLQIKIANMDISRLFQFFYTQATEVNDHNLDPNAHPALKTAMAKAGIHTHIGDRKFVGQTFDGFPNIGGTLNSKSIAYFDTLNDRYEAAVADGSARQYAIGIYLSDTNSIVSEGIVDWPHQLLPYRQLYLSDSTGGQITLAQTSVKVGFALPNNKIFIRIATETSDGQPSLAQDPDGDIEINMRPSLIRELTLVDDNSVKWDITVSDDGVVSTASESTREPDPLFKILRLDESYAQVKINTDGKLVVYSPPIDTNLITDNTYYLMSPVLIAWKFTVDMSNNVVMTAFNNSFFLSSGEYDVFVVRQSEMSRALVYRSTYDKLDLPVEPDLISTLTPGMYLREYDGGRPVNAWWDGYAWRTVGAGAPVGSVDYSILPVAKYQDIRGPGWVQYVNGLDVTGTHLNTIAGITTLPSLGSVSGLTTYIRIN
jgi:hypothetical protein